MSTNYSDYVAPAVSSRGGGAWHIQGDRGDEALCGKILTGGLIRMDLHVSLLECSRCKSLGTNVFSAEVEAVEAWFTEILTYEHFRDWLDADWALAILDSRWLAAHTAAAEARGAERVLAAVEGTYKSAAHTGDLLAAARAAATGGTP